MSMDFFVPSRACYSFVNVIDESCLSYVEAGDLAQASSLNVFQLALIVNWTYCIYNCNVHTNTQHVRRGVLQPVHALEPIANL